MLLCKRDIIRSKCTKIRESLISVLVTDSWLADVVYFEALGIRIVYGSFPVRTGKPDTAFDC